MEELGQGYGYLLYRTGSKLGMQMKNAFELLTDVIELNSLSMANEWQHSTKQKSVKISFIKAKRKRSLDLISLIENMGRVNYGHKFLADTQRKGIRTGVCKRFAFLAQLEAISHFLLITQRIIDFSKGWTEGTTCLLRLWTLKLRRQGSPT